jgi:hypothetical protein
MTDDRELPGDDADTDATSVEEQPAAAQSPSEIAGRFEAMIAAVPATQPAFSSRRTGAAALPINGPLITLTLLMTVIFLMFLLIEPTPRWIALFGGVVAALSLDGILRSQRREPFENGADATPYLFLPALFAIAVPVFAEHNLRDFWAAPVAIAAGIGFGAVAIAEVASVREFDPARNVGRFIAAGATYFVAFALYALIYRFGLGLQESIAAVAFVSALLSIELLHEGEVDPLETLLFAAVTAIAVAEVRWALHFLPLDGYLAGLTLLLSFYFVTGLLHSHLVRQLSITMATEYAIVTAAGIALVVWARAAGLA